MDASGARSDGGQERGFRALLTSERLVPLWVEAADGVRLHDPTDPAWWRWRAALSAIVSAMDEAEHLAASVDPELGRRGWSDRTVVLPAPATPDERTVVLPAPATPHERTVVLPVAQPSSRA
jgi:hypothetical protein